MKLASSSNVTLIRQVQEEASLQKGKRAGLEGTQGEGDHPQAAGDRITLWTTFGFCGQLLYFNACDYHFGTMWAW